MTEIASPELHDPIESRYNYWYDEEHRIEYFEDQFGIVGVEDIITSLQDHNVQCECSPQCHKDWHHLIFNAADAERHIWSAEDETERELLDFFYKSPFGGVELPRCVHEWVQVRSLSTTFPPLETIAKLKEEYTALSVYVNSLNRAQKTYRKLTTANGQSPAPQPVRTMRGHVKAYVLDTLEHKTQGRQPQKERVLALLSHDAILLTPDNLTRSGSLLNLLDDVLASRRIAHADLAKYSKVHADAV